MTKTKQQLRAEAVERLKNSVGARFKPDAAVIAIVGGRIGLADWSLECDKLIDLLTDECGPCYSCAKLAELRAENNALREIVGDLNVPTDQGEAAMMSVDAFVKKQTEHESLDSREKLEADVRKLLYDVWTEGWELGSRDAMGGKDRMCDALALLDRQAAITERHWMEIVGASANANVELKRQIDELQAKVDELTAQLESAHAKNRSLRQHIAKMQAGRHGWHVKGEKLQHEVDRLTRENVSLARDLGECMAERDELKRENARLSSDELYWRNQASQVDTIREARLDKLLSQRDGLQAAYDAMVGKCAELCALAGFSMVDASGEVVG